MSKKVLAAVNVARANEAKARAAYQNVATANISVARADEAKARAAYLSKIDGENTEVAQLKAQVKQALFYLANTTLVAPADGRIINLQVRAGIWRAICGSARLPRSS